MISNRVVISSNCGIISASAESERPLILYQVFHINESDNYIFGMTKTTDSSGFRKPLTADFTELRMKKSRKLLTFNGIKKSHGMMGAILLNEGLPLYPIVAQRGTETFDFLTTSMDSTERVLKAIKKNNRVEDFFYSKISDDDIMNEVAHKNSIFNTLWLTDLEKRVITRAYKKGFFNWPREYRLDMMAREFNITKATLIYHLRNSERKIMKSIFGIE